MKTNLLTKAAVIVLTIGFMVVFTATARALDVKRIELPNGLILLVVERHNLPVVKVSLGIDAGNLYEPEDKSGLAALTASMLSEGTVNRSSQQISEAIEFVGGSVGASSGKDYASVSLSILKKDIDLGFELMSDILLNPAFPADEIEKKVERIKGSLRSSEENPGYVGAREFKRIVMGAHPYGRLVSGTVETIDNIQRDDLILYHKKYYAPNRTVMAVVGDITADEVRQLVNKYLSSWKTADAEAVSAEHVTAVLKRETYMLDRDLTQANILMGHIGVSRGDPDYYSLSVMNYILGGGGFASRLMDNIRDNKGLVYDIHSYFAADRLGGTFQIGLQTKSESANLAISETIKEINRIRTELVTDEELSDAKAFLTGSFPMRIETGERIANFLVAVELYGLGSDYVDEYAGFINAVTSENILLIAKKYLHPEKLVIVVVGDQEKIALQEDFR